MFSIGHRYGCWTEGIDRLAQAGNAGCSDMRPESGRAPIGSSAKNGFGSAVAEPCAHRLDEVPDGMQIGNDRRGDPKDVG